MKPRLGGGGRRPRGALRSRSARWPAAVGARRRRRRAARPGRIVLPQAAPHVPAGCHPATAPAPAGQVLDLDVVLAGQNPAGLAQAVAAVSTPGSPDYRQYLTAAQYAAQYGPSPGRGGAGVLRAAQRGADRRHARAGQHVVAGQRHGVGGLGRARHAAGVGAGAGGVGAGHRQHRIAAGARLADRGGDRRGRPRRPLPGARHAQAGPPGAATTESPESSAAPHGPHATAPATPARAGTERPGPRRTPQACAGAQGAAFGGTLHLDAAGLALRPQPALRAGSHRNRAVHRHRGVRAVRGERLRRLPGLLRAVQLHPQRAGRRRRRRTGRRAGARPRSIRNWPPSTPPPPPSSSTRRPTGATRRRSTSSTASPATTAHRSSRRAGACARRACPPPTGRRRTASSSAWPCRGRP